MNTPTVVTERLILRKFTENDINAIYKIFSDAQVNTFLPWFTLKSLQDAEVFYKTRYADTYILPSAYNYAVCLKTNDLPIGYINVNMKDGYDLGYGLRKEYWRQGLITEAGKAVIGQLKKDGIPYVTATHDINNSRSGAVMKRLGMRYKYTYVEQWQPKNLSVTFRMYQLNLDGNEDRVYNKYWDAASVRFIETNI